MATDRRRKTDEKIKPFKDSEFRKKSLDAGDLAERRKFEQNLIRFGLLKRIEELENSFSSLGAEPALGNPDLTGKILSSTSNGARTWVSLEEVNMVYNLAASHGHSGGNTYETVLDITSGSGQAQIFVTRDPAETTGVQYLKITVDGTAVLEDCFMSLGSGPGWSYGGIWNFSTSLKIEHKSEKSPFCKVAYCLT